MSRSSVRNQLQIVDSVGNLVLSGGPWVPGSPTGQPPLIGGIGTGSWISKAINIDEHRRLSLTIGITGATGAAGDTGGFTGTLLVQGTDELAQCNGVTGTPEAGSTSRPGINGYTGGRFWNTLASGAVNVTANMTSLSVQFTDVGFAFVRCTFNATGWGPAGVTATGTLGGSGTMWAYLTAKHT